MTNIDRAIVEFEGYLAELRTCSAKRRLEIRQAGVACGDLMNYSPDWCWDSEKFRKLDGLVGRVMNSTYGER